MQASAGILASTIAERVRGERLAQEQANRRSDKRFEVQGSLVRLPCRPFQVAGAELDMRNLLFGLLPAFWSQRREVINISKGGLAYESGREVRNGRRLVLQLWLPNHDPLELTGETRWCTRARGRGFHVGVQFDPFGSKPGMNPPAVLEALRSLESKYV